VQCTSSEGPQGVGMGWCKHVDGFGTGLTATSAIFGCASIMMVFLQIAGLTVLANATLFQHETSGPGQHGPCLLYPHNLNPSLLSEEWFLCPIPIYLSPDVAICRKYQATITFP